MVGTTKQETSTVICLKKAGLEQVKCEPVITETDENGENGLYICADGE